MTFLITAISVTLSVTYALIFEGLIFHGWKLGKDFCNFIFEVYLCFSHGLYPDKGKV